MVSAKQYIALTRIPLAECLFEHCQMHTDAVSATVINSSSPNTTPTTPSIPDIDISFEPSSSLVVCVPLLAAVPPSSSVFCAPVTSVGSVASSIGSGIIIMILVFEL